MTLIIEIVVHKSIPQFANCLSLRSRGDLHGTPFWYIISHTIYIVVVILVCLCMSICASQSKWPVLVDFTESYCNCIASYNVTWLVFTITAVLIITILLPY